MGLPQHTLVLTLMVEFDFDLAKKWSTGCKTGGNGQNWPSLVILKAVGGLKGYFLPHS